MLLGTRQSLWRGGRLSARSYVQSGLIAQWDGIENAGWGKHDSNANEWKDLTGNGYDFEMYDPVWTTSSSLFNGYSWGEIGDTSSWKGFDEITIQILFGAKDPVGFLFSSYDASVILYRTSNGDVATYNSAGAHKKWLKTKFNIKNLQGNSFSVIYKNTRDTRMFRNTDELIKTGSDFWGGRGYKTCVASRGRGEDKGICEIYSVRVYSRSLEVKDIAHNYQIDKERFGI